MHAHIRNLLAAPQSVPTCNRVTYRLFLWLLANCLQTHNYVVLGVLVLWLVAFGLDMLVAFGLLFIIVEL